MNSNPTEKKNNSYCCVPQCKSKGSETPNVSFHRFPAIKKVVRKTIPGGGRVLANSREEWRRILRIGKEVSNRMTVCSKHFDKDSYSFPPEKCKKRRLKISALPTLFLPITPYSEEKETKKESSKRLGSYSENNSAPVAIKTVTEPSPAAQDACYLVLECIPGHDKTREENEIAEERNPLFVPPKDDQFLEKWEITIPRKDKILLSKDSVSVLHFEEKCIKTDSITELPDKSINRIPQNQALKDGSDPTIFPNEPSYLSVQTDKRKESAELNIPQQPSDFFKLSAEVENISLPSPWWSVICTEDFIIFAKWNSKYSPERRVVICKSLSIKTFLMNVEVSLSIEECTIENVVQLLEKVDDFIICKNADLRTLSGCLGFVVNKKQEFCYTCYESKKVEKNARSSIAQILVGEKMKCVSQVKNRMKKTCTRMKKTYRRKRVSDINSELVEPKHQSLQTKESFLEAISHLSTEQQTAIKSCHSFKTWFL